LEFLLFNIAGSLDSEAVSVSKRHLPDATGNGTMNIFISVEYSLFLYNSDTIGPEISEKSLA